MVELSVSPTYWWQPSVVASTQWRYSGQATGPRTSRQIPAGYSVQLKGARVVPQACLALGCQERRITRSEAMGIGLVDRGQADAHTFADEHTPGGLVDQRRLGIGIGPIEEFIGQLVPGVAINKVCVPRAGIQIPQTSDGRRAMLEQHGLSIVARSMSTVVIDRSVRLTILADLPTLERSAEARRCAPVHP